MTVDKSAVMIAALALFSAPALAAPAPPKATDTAAHRSEGMVGRSFAAVNGTTIRCPVPVPPSAEQMAMQFDTNPRNLDALSAMVKRMTDAPDEAGVAMLKRQADQRATDWPFLCRYRDANADLKEADRRPAAVFMGDSITEGWINADPAFFSRNDYVDRGISGQSSSQMLARFYDDVVALRPRAVHLMAGTNDIGGATGPVTEDESVNNITAMIDIAQANGIKVVLAGIPPMSRLLPRPEFDVRPGVLALNRRFKALADARGLTFVDYYAHLASPDGTFDPRFANDGVHPTRAGYAVMEPLSQAALARQLGRVTR